MIFYIQSSSFFYKLLQVDFLFYSTLFCFLFFYKSKDLKEI